MTEDTQVTYEYTKEGKQFVTPSIDFAAWRTDSTVKVFENGVYSKTLEVQK